MATVDGEALKDSAYEHLLMHYTRHGNFGPGRGDVLVLESGDGPYVYDTRGNRYLDALSTLFCSQLGWSYGAEFGAVAAEQLERLAFASNWAMAHTSSVELAERIAELAPAGLNRVLFTSGGSESVEAAWKIVRHHHLASGQPQRTKAIARDVAYHGTTLGALALTGVTAYKTDFDPPAIDARHVSNTNRFRAPDADDEAAFCKRLLDEIEQAVIDAGPDEVAMFIAEPVQNAGGCLMPPDGYWPGVRELADRYGFLVVADEVISAFGRVGEWFGSTRVDAAPDVMTMAKGLTSAHAPMGGVIVSDRVAEPLYYEGVSLRHGYTYGGHPLCSAIALKNLEIFERDGIIENVRELEGHLERRMRELLSLPIVGDVRGAGFFWAAELVKDADNTRFDALERERLLRGYLPGRLLQAGIIARPDDRGDAVVQVAPPLICDRAQLDEMVDGLAEALADAGEHMGLGSSPVGASAG
jgi:adenosylmethionine-8-amino-7-oxononanoate aminotransferase